MKGFKDKDGKFHPINNNRVLKNKSNIHEGIKLKSKPRKYKISDQQAFDDFWQTMHERGGVFDIFSELGIDLDEAMKGIATKKDISNHYYWHIAPAEVNKKTQEKIIDHYGGIEGIKEFMAYNAGWEEYQKELESEMKMKMNTDTLNAVRDPKNKNWGFDLTNFQPNTFQKILKDLGIPKEYQRSYHENGDGRGFIWEGEGIMIETKNNPITGEYGTQGMREPEKDYAGYIGITGEPDQVDMAVKLIKKYGGSKDESPNKRSFI